MDKLTVDFDTLENGLIKATVYEGTNKYLMMTVSETVGGCMQLITDRIVGFNMYMNESLMRRAD